MTRNKVLLSNDLYLAGRYFAIPTEQNRILNVPFLFVLLLSFTKYLTLCHWYSILDVPRESSLPRGFPSIPFQSRCIGTMDPALDSLEVDW